MAYLSRGPSQSLDSTSSRCPLCVGVSQSPHSSPFSSPFLLISSQLPALSMTLIIISRQDFYPAFQLLSLTVYFLSPSGCLFFRQLEGLLLPPSPDSSPPLDLLSVLGSFMLCVILVFHVFAHPDPLWNASYLTSLWVSRAGPPSRID